jgi:HAD superfamily hydrolase (TIGR01549 family)
LLSVYENKTTYSAAFIKFCKTHGMDNIDKFYQEAFEKKKYYEDTRELFAGVTETLAYLKKEEIKRVIVSDNELSSEALIEQVLNKYCIGDQFEYIFTSIDLRRTKAEREYFQLVLDNLDLGCNEVLFVGHDAEEIITANSVGIETIEFNNYLGIPAAPKQKIKKIADLIQVIKNYDSGN